MKEDKLFNEIKSAAESAETKDFPGMENVWQRVENKLDKKEDRKAIGRWKKIAIAASLLLVGTLGYEFFKNDPNTIKPEEVITKTDSIKNNNPVNDALVISEPSKPEQKTMNPDIKKDASEIIQKQIKPTAQVAYQETAKGDDMMKEADMDTQLGYPAQAPAAKSEIISESKSSFKARKAEEKDVEMFMNRNAAVSKVQKEEPLLIIDDKVSKKKLQQVEFTEADSLVVLNEPLYIINGVEYTEQEVFGPNPTSPYTPLNKQEIETFSVLQNEKAVEIYGNKGKKGVVIITTKNGKPVKASNKK